MLWCFHVIRWITVNADCQLMHVLISGLGDVKFVGLAFFCMIVFCCRNRQTENIFSLLTVMCIMLCILSCTVLDLMLFYIFSNKIPVLRDYIIILLYDITLITLAIEWKHLHCVSSLLWFVWVISIKYMIKQAYENPVDCKTQKG